MGHKIHRMGVRIRVSCQQQESGTKAYLKRALPSYTLARRKGQEIACLHSKQRMQVLPGLAENSEPIQPGQDAYLASPNPPPTTSQVQCSELLESGQGAEVAYLHTAPQVQVGEPSQSSERAEIAHLLAGIERQRGELS